MKTGYKPVNDKTLADVNRANRKAQGEATKDGLIPHPPLIREMIEKSGIAHDEDFGANKAKLESLGYKATGTHKATGSTIFKHPKEKGSVMLHPSGHVVSGEFGS